jgi:hypothetical protein
MNNNFPPPIPDPALNAIGFIKFVGQLVFVLSMSILMVWTFNLVADCAFAWLQVVVSATAVFVVPRLAESKYFHKTSWVIARGLVISFFVVPAIGNFIGSGLLSWFETTRSFGWTLYKYRFVSMYVALVLAGLYTAKVLWADWRDYKQAKKIENPKKEPSPN